MDKSESSRPLPDEAGPSSLPDTLPPPYNLPPDAQAEPPRNTSCTLEDLKNQIRANINFITNERLTKFDIITSRFRPSTDVPFQYYAVLIKRNAADSLRYGTVSPPWSILWTGTPQVTEFQAVESALAESEDRVQAALRKTLRGPVKNETACCMM